MIVNFRTGLLAGASALALFSQAAADDAAVDTIVVVGAGKTYSAAETSEAMALQQAPITNVLAQIDNLPGVLVSEGDAFGSDDWSTTISLRGFQSNLAEQQVGITIDGLPNGNSNYGGGAKANRFIDTPNLAGAEVSQGTADIASRSLEALGGTINFLTDDPVDEARMRILLAGGSFDAQKYYARYDTGEILPNTYAYVSFSHQENTDWINSAAKSPRDHAALKVVSEVNGVDLTAYVSYDDSHERNYNSISLAEFAENPEWDRLTAEWTDIPYVNQQYRPAWGTLRKNIFGYLRAEFEPIENVKVSGTFYDHELDGRGDWVPPYMVDVIADGAGNPQSELFGTRTDGGSPLGRFFFVDADGVALSPDPACASSITFPYGGAGPEYDPACYPSNAIPVQSYRHTHYQQSRWGLTGDFAWTLDLDGVSNTLRGGVWYEDKLRSEWRDWHQLIDARTGADYEYTGYWAQYNREFPYQTFMYYVEDSLDLGPVTARFGIKQFFIDLEREDLFGDTANVAIDSDSDLLLSGGLVWRTPIDGLEVFGGYAENFSAIKDGVLEAGATALTSIEPETAENIDFGVRFSSGRFSGSLTGYNIKFENRVTYVPATLGSGAPDYLNETAGSYINVGGIESTGVEIAANYRLTDTLSFYGAYTKNDSEYVGTGDAAADAALGIQVGNQVRGAMDQAIVASLDWAYNDYFAGFSYKWVDEIFLDQANTRKLESYGVGDLYVGVNGGAISSSLKGVEARLVVNNIFDEDYMAGVVGDDTTAYIGAPRSAVFTITADF